MGGTWLQLQQHCYIIKLFAFMEQHHEIYGAAPWNAWDSTKILKCLSMWRNRPDPRYRKFSRKFFRNTFTLNPLGSLRKNNIAPFAGRGSYRFLSIQSSINYVNFNLRMIESPQALKCIVHPVRHSGSLQVFCEKLYAHGRCYDFKGQHLESIF